MPSGNNPGIAALRWLEAQLSARDQRHKAVQGTAVDAVGRAQHRRQPGQVAAARVDQFAGLAQLVMPAALDELAQIEVDLAPSRFAGVALGTAEI